MVALFKTAFIALPKANLFPPKGNSNPRCLFTSIICVLFLALSPALAQLHAPRPSVCSPLSRGLKPIKSDPSGLRCSRKAHYSSVYIQPFLRKKTLKNMSEALSLNISTTTPGAIAAQLIANSFPSPPRNDHYDDASSDDEPPSVKSQYGCNGEVNKFSSPSSPIGARGLKEGIQAPP